MPVPTLTICLFALDDDLIETVRAALDRDRFALTLCHSPTELIETLSDDWSHFDSLILPAHNQLPELAQRLHQERLLLPAIIVLPPGNANGNAKANANGAEVPAIASHPSTSPITHSSANSAKQQMAAVIANPPAISGDRSKGQLHIYHPAEVTFDPSGDRDLDESITQALAQFLQLKPADRLNSPSPSNFRQTTTLLEEKQRLLTDKLKERLGYLGVYYKRNSQRFLRNLSAAEALELIEQLQALYQDIVLQYFDKNRQVNQAIDEFVYLAFFADISVTRVVELHMDLMDQFSKQLQLEGRSEEILLDYRLTLIDVIAHLSEMYRRSIPRESQ